MTELTAEVTVENISCTGEAVFTCLNWKISVCLQPSNSEKSVALLNNLSVFSHGHCVTYVLGSPTGSERLCRENLQ